MKSFPFFFILLLTASAQSQTQQKPGGACEGCEAIYECPVPFTKLKDSAQLPGWRDAAQPLIVKGRVTDHRGRPVPGVVIYIYHTGADGRYVTNGETKGWAKRHGRLRAWVRTNTHGEYQFQTQMPGVYPERNAPAHIHMTLKEPGLNEYWIDEIEFADDPLLTAAERKTRKNRCGSGIVTVNRKNRIWIAERNIQLGLNIPGHPFNHK